MISNQDALFDVAAAAATAGRTVIFDLDNTLYDEADYLTIAYRGFANEVAPQLGVDPAVAAGFMRDALLNGRRSSLLQDFSAAYALDLELGRAVLFRHLRDHPLGETLALYDWAQRLLGSAPDMSQLAIITNGNPAQQANKIAHLPGLSGFHADRIVFANLHGGKPLPAAGHALAQVMPLRDPLYIGDSESDAAFASAAGFAFFRAEYQPFDSR